MASVNFKKLHSRSEVAAMLEHDDAEERVKHEHSNKQINKAETYKNKTWRDMSYKDTLKAFKKRIDVLDETTNTNKRKDRIEAYSLSIPVPEGVPAEDFFKSLCDFFEQDFGKDNLINAYLHCDEIHEYIDKDCTVRESLAHIHAIVVPEINGVLVAKKFSSKKAMSGINKAIDGMCKKEFNVPFLTGGTAERKTVEELKEESEARTEMLERLIQKEEIKPKSKVLDNYVVSKKDFEILQTKAAAFDVLTEQESKKEKSDKQIRAELQQALKDRDATETKISELVKTVQEKKKQESELDSAIDEKEWELASLQDKYTHTMTVISKNKTQVELEGENSTLMLQNEELKRELSRERNKLDKILDIIKKSPVTAITGKIRQIIESKDIKEHRSRGIDR